MQKRKFRKRKAKHVKNRLTHAQMNHSQCRLIFASYCRSRRKANVDFQINKWIKVWCRRFFIQKLNLCFATSTSFSMMELTPKSPMFWTTEVMACIMLTNNVSEIFWRRKYFATLSLRFFRRWPVVRLARENNLTRPREIYPQIINYIFSQIRVGPEAIYLQCKRCNSSVGHTSCQYI